MRLLVATPLYPPESGGPATYAAILEETLPGEDIEVELVKFSEVRHLPKLVRHCAYFWKVYQKAKHSDIILALDPVSTGLPALCASVLRRKPFVVKVVGDYAWEQGCQRYGVLSTLDVFVHERAVPVPVSFLRFVQSLVVKSARAAIVPSTYLRRIVATWGVPKEHIVVIHNAVQPEEPTTIPAEVEVLSRPRMVTIGRLVPWKGMAGIITAVEQIRKTIPELSLVIVGDGPERNNIETYAKARLGEGFVLTGALPHQEALAVLKDADVFVLNSTYEGLSHLLIEALSLGTPCVATSVGGNPELVEHEANGLLVPPKDPTALAAVCIRLLQDATLRARFIKEGPHSMQSFTKEAMASRTAEFLRTHV